LFDDSFGYEKERQTITSLIDYFTPKIAQRQALESALVRPRVLASNFAPAQRTRSIAHPGGFDSFECAEYDVFAHWAVKLTAEPKLYITLSRI
jgi:hypothetical protein